MTGANTQQLTADETIIGAAPDSHIHIATVATVHRPVPIPDPHHPSQLPQDRVMIAHEQGEALTEEDLRTLRLEDFASGF